MTEQEKNWFDALTKDREESALTLEKPSMRGIKNSVVEKYSDQAHFIYELLQNANDAKATYANFDLTKEGLYFIHNGKIKFSVSNPENEDQDKNNNSLGHINSITSIANSNKTESSIGKFGVGFKAVFQYTDTPHIYDPSFHFKIERFIIPIKLEEKDRVERQNDETVFYFPFNKKDIPVSKAYNDILQKLKNLTYPTLFLNELIEVKWSTESVSGKYSKKNVENQYKGKVNFQLIELQQKIGDHYTKERILLFSKKIEDVEHSYSIGYFINEENKLIPKKHPAFCYFPTKENTDLNFIIHAPFLLTDSREGIKRFEDHNDKMIELLADLSAESLHILKEKKLIDDTIFDILPFKENNDFFEPFFTLIKQQFCTEELLPSFNHEYVIRENAYWADSPDIAKLFSNRQLALITNNYNAKWVFTSISRSKNKELTDYIDGSDFRINKEPKLIKRSLDFENNISNMIDENFIKNQNIEWLHKFYEYLYERKSYQDKFKTKPIFKDSQGNAVAAFEKNNGEINCILFLPIDESSSTYRTIDPELLKNSKTKEFIENFGIKKPSLKDEIYNNILPLYKSNDGIDTTQHFKLFFKYWKEEGRPEDFIRQIKNVSFILYKTLENETRYRGEPNEIYFPTDDLIKYFETKSDTKFVDIETYYSFNFDENEKLLLKDFLIKLGVNFLPKIIEKQITNPYEKNRIKNYDGYFLYPSSNIETIDKILDGCRELLNNIDKEKSVILWKILGYLDISHLKGVHKYQRYGIQCQYFESLTIQLLKIEKWVVNHEQKFVAPSEIYLNELSEIYEKNSKLDVLLGFKKELVLTYAERIASKFESEEEAEEARIALKEKKDRIERLNERQTLSTNKTIDFEEFENIIESLENLSELVSKPLKNKKGEKPLPNFNEDEEFAKGVSTLQKQIEIKKTRVELAENLNNSVKYSYDWFKAYLQLLTTFGEKQDIQKQKLISFQEIKPYKTDNKYFLLCGTSSYISPEIENADDFKVSLVFGNGKRENITVEGVSKKGQDLLIYCREPLSNNTLSRLSNIFKVEINFTPVVDLLDRLYKAFVNDNYIDRWDNIKEAMPSIDFIYGPPGTGKTTIICNSINNIIDKNSKAKILVLTPTNKAADVVCKKLQDINNNLKIVRLSRPTDPELEEFEIYRDTLNVEDFKYINIIASTIHRLPYFDIQEIGLLFQYEWDYVVFDESSMAGLHYITFAIMALFKTNPDINFIIAGDPKQIPPVIEIDEKEFENFDFQDENIYKMMELESFNPDEQIIREIDSIINLKTQYRSIPKIGQLFSELSYSKLLVHDRATNRKETKKLPEKFNKLISSNVTFIDIPLSQDNSIYKVNKLFYSSYHTYCAILVSEIIRYFDTLNKDEKWTIGLIAPYKAQAILLNKLITSYRISENVKVLSDTVHGFQGDECDIVFFVCNPNNYYYSGHEKALLSKEYIYNVAISRAKDFLIILHPFTAIQNNYFINKIGHSYKNNFGNTKILNANDIENMLFNDRNYIENNSYISGHDNVNVFGLSEMKYFIKANDTAIDIQLRDLENLNINGKLEDQSNN
jgi:hypothetical protein